MQPREMELLVAIITAIITALGLLWVVGWAIFKYRRGKLKRELEIERLKDEVQERKSLIQKPTPEEVRVFKRRWPPLRWQIYEQKK